MWKAALVVLGVLQLLLGVVILVFVRVLVYCISIVLVRIRDKRRALAILVRGVD